MSHFIDHTLDMNRELLYFAYECDFKQLDRFRESTRTILAK